MAKNLNTFMPGIKKPEQLIHGYELFTTYQSQSGDVEVSGARAEEYGRTRTRFHLKESMCDIKVSITGGGEGGAGFCCCMQGSPGFGSVSQRYSVCCHTGSGGQAGTNRCCEYIIMCIGAGGCLCSTCTGHESCMSTMHHCSYEGHSYMCICAGAPNGGSITNCFWGYSNDDNKGSRALAGCYDTFCCYGSNCADPNGSCRSHETGTKTSTDPGWDCNYCISCAHSGFNMYKSQCCSDGRCGVYQMSSGPNFTSPYMVGDHIIAMGNACQQEHNGFSGGTCEMWYKFGQIGQDVSHMRMRGRSTATGSGCAGGCKCGSTASPGWGYIRWKDPDYETNGHG